MSSYGKFALKNTGSKDPNDGCIKGNCDNGYGEFKYNNGKYSGNFVNGKLSGQGKFTWLNGTYYEGSWFKGRKHGYGKTINQSGYSEIGEFHKGKIKLAKITWPNGDICEEYVKTSCRGNIISKNSNGTSGNFEFTTSIGKHKNTCKELGFTLGTEKFGNCALKLIELEVAQQGNKKAVQQIQIVKQQPAYDGWMGELGLSLLRGDFNKKVQQPAYKFPTQQHSTCRWQSGGIGKPYMTCTTSPF